ncbi:UDP-N-acetylmuramoyl-tripeptide--D-alanyl-D-alanine ligase [Allopseudospirillum japonicum]|uniref:UDP-N-acetylmuramoyl-tripeptide--D-alanyl-D-alanine ligase n=1 Tax=Allopseudospirillum japonicum TaxID=64971 RepID=A0A1H6QLJ0_9GAMM|nr:UDP-N-acetylmuramoyl-tripeptide--D-alanyl-D-alanine ligase [Allopseudospirillum japonicum]SEI40155.1 UDP-N-acetylmuramoyl-tripeptide--D-alanyl-D-alanine ligase [Allopseudospirillum japonicum]
MLPIALQVLCQQIQGRLYLPRSSTLTPESLIQADWCLDSRQVRTGDIFVAYQGQHLDSHAYLGQAAQAGACLAVVEKYQAHIEIPQITVLKALSALAQIAQYQRQQLELTCIGITGNSGKTGVRQLMQAILQQAQHPACITQGNFNNEVGLPLTLLDGLQPETHTCLLEMGAAQAGDLSYLCQIAQPNIGLITNVTGAHIGRFGSLDQIAEAKAELIRALPQGGIAVLNMQDAFYPYWRTQVPDGVTCISFAQEMSADIYATSVQAGPQACYRFQLQLPHAPSLPIQLNLLGRHQVDNALAAASLAYLLRIPAPAIQAGLQEVQPSQGRLYPCTSKQGAYLIDDTYNASPGAVKAAIDILQDAKADKTCVLVLGDLAELGDYSAQLHAELGAYAAQAGVHHLYTLGQNTRYTHENFCQKLAPKRQSAYHADTQEELLNALQHFLAQHPHPQQVRVLVKGARSAAMEKLVQAFIQ